MPDLHEHPLVRAHVALLERFRDAMNLVGPGDVRFHVDDCARALDGLAPTGRWADLGSGAGFPGIPFAALFPNTALDLVDSRRKRCVFLEEVLAAGLPAGHAPVRVVCERLETLPAASYDGVTARALAPPDQVAAWADRLLVPGGRLVAMLQPDQQLPAGSIVESDRTYEVGGKTRRVVVTRRR